MSDLEVIKRRIYEEEKIEEILKSLDCQNISFVSGRYEAQLPIKYESSNRRAVQVYNNENLSSRIRNKGLSGDIYTLVGFFIVGTTSYEEACSHIFEIKKWICDTLDWNEYLSRWDDEFEEEKVDHILFLKKIKKKRQQRNRKQSKLEKENTILEEAEIYWQYDNYPHVNFLEDGISLKTQREFEVMFDRSSHRVVFPIRNRNGKLISIKGRYVGNDENVANDFKYLYLYNFDKMIELYNWHKAIEYILEKGEVIVFESEKSCMKAWQYGIKNTVAIMGSEMSIYQAHLLKGLNVNIIFAFDNDMDADFVKKQSSQIKTRKCYFIKDKFNLLDKKDAIVDKGKDTFVKLYQECVMVI